MCLPGSDDQDDEAVAAGFRTLKDTARAETPVAPHKVLLLGPARWLPPGLGSEVTGGVHLPRGRENPVRLKAQGQRGCICRTEHLSPRRRRPAFTGPGYQRRTGDTSMRDDCCGGEDAETGHPKQVRIRPKLPRQAASVYDAARGTQAGVVTQCDKTDSLVEGFQVQAGFEPARATLCCLNQNR
jgi:hypothetical protein